MGAIGDAWKMIICTEVISISDRKDFECDQGRDSKIYVCMHYRSKSIWPFLGLSSQDGGEESADDWAQCYSSDRLVDNDLNNQVSEVVFNSLHKNNSASEFTKRGRNRHWLERKNPLYFEPKDILTGLKDNDWEAALAPLQDAWDPLVEHIDWDAISAMLKADDQQ